VCTTSRFAVPSSAWKRDRSRSGPRCRGRKRPQTDPGRTGLGDGAQAYPEERRCFICGPRSGVKQ